MFLIILGVIIGLIMFYVRRNMKTTVEDPNCGVEKQDVKNNFMYTKVFTGVSIALIIAGIVLEILGVM